MAMSLEALLAEEGFHRRKAKIVSRSPYTSEGRPRVPLSGRDESSSSHNVKKVSEIPRYSSKREASTSNSFNGRKPRDTFIRREKLDSESETQKNDAKLKSRGHQDSWDGARFNVRTSADSQVSEITEVAQGYEIVEVGNDSPYKDIYFNKAYGYEENESRNSTRDEERERYRQRSGKNMAEDKKIRTNSFKHPLSIPKRGSANTSNWKLMNQPESSTKKTFDENKSTKQPNLEETLDTLALDEAAVKAIVSILSGYIKRFLKDEDFRTSLRHNSFASLNFIGLEEGLNTESKVIENLEQAIETVERAAEDSASVKELKKASLQLSVITGLNSNDLKDGFTSGIPNLKLSACAHLYLSVIYVVQKKDKITAKNILQVFCDSPFQARVALLPDLWDHVFLPNLLHLKLWYEKEALALADSPVSANLNCLDKVYNETLDSGTHKFAKYYKDWLTEGLEAPSLPVVKIPSFSVQLMPKGGLHGHTNSPASYLSPQPMVSKKLYDEVFRHAHKAGFEPEIYEEDFEISARSSNSPAPEDKQLILYDSITSTNQYFKPDGESLPGDLCITNEAHSESSIGVTKLDEKYRNPQNYQKNSHPITLQIEFEHTVQELRENHEEFRDKPYLASIPKDFVCPLTGLIFEDPVTLETGQSFEREAITDWFDKGSITCPVTRKTLQFQVVPPTNLILKRVIDNWKTDHLQHLLAIVSQVAADSAQNTSILNDDTIICILEQLLVILSGKARVENTKRVLSLGGLQFLLRRFHSGNAKEKAFILPLLLCCIEADAECRNDLTRNISKSSLLELLHGEQLKTVTDAVLLLNELICLNRRMDSQNFSEGINEEELANAMDDLLIHLKTCTLEETPLVAVLLLHFNLLSRAQMSNVYRQEAVDALTVALEQSLTDEKVQKKCSRALLILGGCFSSSGKLMTEDWILKLAGFLNGPDWDIAYDESSDISFDGRATMKVDFQIGDSEEEKAREKWLLSVSASLLEDGNKPFLETVSKCLNLGNSDLVRVCLVTVAWLSASLASLSDTEFQLYAFSALISPLKKCMEHGELVEHKILASLCLLNFSKFPECRILLMKIADQIYSSVENLVEVTWTADELCAIIPGRGLGRKSKINTAKIVYF